MAAKKQNANKSVDLFKSIQERTPKNTEDLFGFSAFIDEDDKDKLKKDIQKAEEKGVEMIDIDLLDANELSKYHMRDEESFEALKALIKENGFEKSFAVVGKKKPDGRVTILSGHRRTAVAKSLTDENGLPLITKVPITYKEFEREVKELEFVTAANLKRADNLSDILSMYQLFSEHFDNGDWTKEETEGYGGKMDFIAGKMGLSVSKLKNNLFLLRYDPAIWEYIDLGVLSVSDIRKLHADSENGKLKNHDEIIKSLCKSKTLKRAGESDEALASARKEAKEILSGAKRKYERKAKPKSAAKLISRVRADLDDSQKATAEGLSKKERTLALKELSRIRKELDRLEKMLKEG